MTMTTTFNQTTSFTVVSCYSCGVSFGMPTEMNRARLEDKRTWYCPNGHSQHYIGKTEAEKRAEVAEKRAEMALNNADYWRREQENTRKSLTAVKGQLTKTKNRIANGVCPECHRHFVNLERHMKGQHDDS